MTPLAHPARLLALHPVLAVSDVERALAFYGQLGFRETFRDRDIQPLYACLVRDAVELHLQWHAEPPVSVNGDRPVLRIVVDDVDALHAQWQSAGCLTFENNGRSPWASPADTPWGTREFHLCDPDGHGLQLYRART